MEGNPVTNIEIAPKLADGLKRLAEKTKHQGAWSETFKKIKTNPEDPNQDLMLLLVDDILTRNRVIIPDNQKIKLADEYDALRESAGINPADETIDHEALVAYLLRQKGIIKPLISRRNILRMGGAAAALGVAGYIASQLPDFSGQKPASPALPLPPEPYSPRLKPPPESTPIPLLPPAPILPTQEIVKTTCLGTFDAQNISSPELFNPETGERIILKDIPKTFEIKGYGAGEKGSFSSYRYTIYDPATNKYYEVPIRQVNIIEGSPLKEDEININPFFGIRVTEPKFFEMARKMGVGKVRINGEGCEVNSQGQINEKLHKSIREATRNNLEIILVFHPNHPLDRAELKLRIDRLLSKDCLGGYGKVAIELGNEPDDPNVNFWQNRDPDTFSQFIKDSTAVIRENPNGKNIKLILGALNTQPNTEKWFKTFMENGVNLNNYEIGLHAYDNAGISLQDWVKYLRQYLSWHNINSPICITEFGIPNYDKRGIVEQLEFVKENARNLNISGLLLHELEDYEANFGFINPYDGSAYPSFFTIQRATQLLNS